MVNVALGYPASKKAGPEEDDSEDEEGGESCMQSTSNTCKDICTSCCTRSGSGDAGSKQRAARSLPEMTRDSSNKNFNITATSEEREYFGSSQSGFSQPTYISINTSEPTVDAVRKQSQEGVIDEEEEVDFDGVWILENVTLEVAPKSLNVLVGVTGAGKSTLLQGGLLGECKHICGDTAMTGKLFML